MLSFLRTALIQKPKSQRQTCMGPTLHAIKTNAGAKQGFEQANAQFVVYVAEYSALLEDLIEN